MVTIEIKVLGPTNFDIVDEGGKVLDTIGIFPGQPEGMPPGNFYLARNLDFGRHGCRGRMVGTSGTVDEAQWVCHGLARIEAEHLLALVGGGEVIDNTAYFGKENPYQDKLDLFVPRFRDFIKDSR